MNTRINTKKAALKKDLQGIRDCIVDALSLKQYEKTMMMQSSYVWAESVLKVSRAVKVAVLVHQYKTLLDTIAGMPDRIELIAGRVKWFNDAKGYGYIETDTIKDIFVHYTAIKMDGFQSLQECDLVLFELVTGDKGPQAFNVVKARSALVPIEQNPHELFLQSKAVQS